MLPSFQFDLVRSVAKTSTIKPISLPCPPISCFIKRVRWLKFLGQAREKDEKTEIFCFLLLLVCAHVIFFD
jgi:hypothetical protein